MNGEILKNFKNLQRVFSKFDKGYTYDLMGAHILLL